MLSPFHILIKKQNKKHKGVKISCLKYWNQKKYQIISNVKVDIRTEFELVNKALKAVTSFSGEPIYGLIIEDNVIFLCWGCSKRADKDVNFE